MITFCVITCTYNAVRELSRTIDSVERQTYANVVHIIMDGLSDDGTADMARQYARRCGDAGSHHVVIVVSERDGGLYDAMNKAIGIASGDYVLFLNAGDTFADDNTLERVAAMIGVGEGKELPAVVYGNTDIVDAQGRFLHRRRLQPPERLTWRSFRMGMLVCHQAFYARTDMVKRILYDRRYRFSADVDWCIRIMREAERQGLGLFNTHITLCKYLDGGLTVKNHRASLIERFRIMVRHYGLFTTLAAHVWFVIRK